jgi:thiamine biosynthesis protein ThiS
VDNPRTITLNGSERQVRAATVAQLLAELGLPVERIGIRRNGHLVMRAEWASEPLCAGDRVEIQHFIGGG